MSAANGDKMAAGTVALDHIEFTPNSGRDADIANDDSKADPERVASFVVSSDEVRKYTKSDDAAMKAMAEYNGPPLVLDEATSRRLLRKIDWYIMPILYEHSRNLDVHPSDWILASSVGVSTISTRSQSPMPGMQSRLILRYAAD
jgi:hypothetical protein